MTAKELGAEPASPAEVTFSMDSYKSLGLSKREYFAGLAMLGLISGETGEYHFRRISGITEKAAKYADALLEELAKEK